MTILGDRALSDENKTSESANHAGHQSQVTEPGLLKLEITSKQSSGELKPAMYQETNWVPFKEDEVETEGQVADSSPVSEVVVPPVPEGLNAPKSGDSTSAPSESITPQTKDIVEESVDLRPPDVSSAIEDDEEQVEPKWLNPFVDDHLYLWRENRESLELLFDNGSGFGMTTLGFDATILGGDGPLWANFKFSWHFLEGPLQPDIRSQTYDLSLELNHAMQLDETWGLHLQLAPTWATDWDNKSGDAFRLIGGGLLTMKYDEGVTFLFGAMALDRPDLPVVPTAGVRIWGDDLELDLVIPRPRVSWKLSDENNEESWFYVAGEIGGGSWAVERELNRKDIMGYRDNRLLVGWETKKVDGTRHVFELGWVFDRKLEFDRFGGDQNLGETFLLRWGQTY